MGAPRRPMRGDRPRTRAPEEVGLLPVVGCRGPAAMEGRAWREPGGPQRWRSVRNVRQFGGEGLGKHGGRAPSGPGVGLRSWLGGGRAGDWQPRRRDAARLRPGDSRDPENASHMSRPTKGGTRDPVRRCALEERHNLPHMALAGPVPSRPKKSSPSSTAALASAQGSTQCRRHPSPAVSIRCPISIAPAGTPLKRPGDCAPG